MNNFDLIGFNKRLWKLKKYAFNFVVCYVFCFFVAFGYIFKLNPVKTDLSETFSSSKNVIILITLLVIGIISFIASLITKSKINECISYIDPNKYEECDVCKSYKLKGSNCTFPHDNKEMLLLPFMIFAFIFVFLIILLYFLL